MALTAIGPTASTTKNAELEESNPEMGLATKVIMPIMQEL
jgi:hypothetical protein